MVLVFDSTTVAAADRAEALHVALAETSASSVELLERGSTVSARLDVWPVGTSYLFRAEASPVRMFRSEGQARREPVPLLALAVQERGEGHHHQFASASPIGPGVLMGMDMTEAFQFSWTGLGASRALMMPLDELDLMPDLVRHALPHLERSPLYDLVRHHIVELFTAADELTTSSSAPAIGRSSVELARALLMSVSADERVRREGAASTLLLRVRECVRQNIRDPGLDAAMVAHTVGVSVRQLYVVCAAADLSLEQLIIRRRLHGARAELSLPAARRRTIAAVAHGWGFRNVSHFTRRFSLEFEVSPREWRARAATAPKERGPR